MLVPKKKGKRPHVKHEAHFEAVFASVARMYKSAYIKIPDPIKSKDSLIEGSDGKVYMREDKRPYDGVLATPIWNYNLELKYNYGKTKPHQVKNGAMINEINGSFFIVRKIDKLKEMIKQGKIEFNSITYRVESETGERFVEFSDVGDLVKWFAQERRDVRELREIVKNKL